MNDYTTDKLGSMIYGPSTVKDKTETLNQNKQDKLSNLVKVDIVGNYDAESPRLASTGKTARLSEDNYYVQSPELKDRDGRLTREGMNATIQADNYMMGVDAPNFPEGEGLDPKYWSTYRKYMDQALRDRQASGELSVYDTGLRSKDSGHRPLVKTESGMPMSQTDYLIEKGQGTRENVFSSPKGPEVYTGETTSFADQMRAEGRGEGRLGEAIDLVQAEATRYWGDMAGAARSGSRALAGTLGVSKENIDKYLPENPKLLGTDLTIEEARKDQAKTDASVGYSTRALWNQEQKAFEEAVGEGNYGTAAWNVVKNLDRYLATSAPEMAVLMVPGAGIPTVVATRLNNQMEEFEKTNGRKMTTGEAFETAASILPALVGEKLLVKSGVAGALGKGKSVKDRAIGVGLSTTGEALQEAAEATQEQWATGLAEDRYDLGKLGEYATSDKTIGGAIAGGVMGGALRGAGEVAGAALDGTKDILVRNPAEEVDPTEGMRPELKAQVDAITKGFKAENVTDENWVTAFRVNTKEGSESREKLKNIATNLVEKGQDDLNILGSELDVAEKARRVEELVSFVSSESGLDDVTKSKLVDVLKGALGEQAAMDVVTRGAEVGTAIKTLTESKGTPRGNMLTVSDDASHGSRGFVTYFNEAREAQAVGNEAGFENTLGKLEKFMGVHTEKLARVLAAERQVTAQVRAEVQAHADARGITVGAAVKELKKQYAEGRKNGKEVVDVKYGANGKFKIAKETVLDNLVDDSVSTYGRGFYGVLNSVKTEVDAMEKLYGTLTGNTTVKAPVDEVRQAAEIIKKNSEQGTEATPEELQVVQNVIDEGRGEEINAELEAMMGEFDEEAAPGSAMDEQPLDQVYDDEVPPTLTMEDEEALAQMNREYDDEVYPRDVFEDELDVYDDETAPGEKRVPEYVGPSEWGTGTKAELDKAIEDIKKVNKEIDKARAEGKDVESLLGKKAKLQEKMDPRSTELFKHMANRRAKLSSGEGTVGRTLGWVFKIKKANPLNGSNITLNPFVKELVEKAIKAPDMTKAGIVNVNDSGQDPARAFLFNSNGEINANVATAMYKSMLKYLAEDFGDLSRTPDAEQLREMVPMISKLEKAGDFDEIARIEEFFLNGGKMLKFEAESIGSSIVDSLEIGITDKANLTDMAKLKASFGGMSLLMAKEMGWVDVDNGDVTNLVFPGEKEYTSFVKAKPGKIFELTGVKNSLDKMDEVYSLEGSTLEKTYKFAKPSGTGKVEVHNQPYGDTTELQAKFKHKLSTTPYKVNSGIDVFKEMFENSKEELKELLGYIDEDSNEFKKKFYDAKASARSVNNEIQRKVDGFYTMLEESSEGADFREMFFDYFVAKNGRTNMNSTTVSPQVDKQLARWLVTTTTSRTEIDLGKTDADSTIAFKYGVVQAFEGNEGIPSIDKGKEADILAKADELLEMSDEELKGMVKDADHPGHAMLAISNIRKAKKDDVFESDMVVEVDGLTNGIAFRFLQFPIGKIKQLLPKVGVVLEGTKEYAYDTMSEVKASKEELGFLDVYEEVGENMVPATLDKIDQEVKDIVKDFILDVATPVKRAGESDAEYKSRLKKVAKAKRDLAKSPVLVTGYSAGEASTKRAIVKERIDKLLEAISDTLELDENGEVAKVPEVVEALAKLVKTDGKTLLGNLNNKSILSKELKPLRSRLERFFRNEYAEPMYEALIAVVGDLKEAGDQVTTAYAYMYKVMEKEYKKRLEEYKLDTGKNYPSEEDAVKLMRDLLKDVGPTVNSSESIGMHDKVIALSRALVDIYKLTGDKSDLKADVHKKDGSTLGVRLIMRTFGEPGAAGGVLQTHTEDNHTMARAFEEVEDRFNQVFDAIVLGAGQGAVIKGYNKSFWELNKGFSMMTAVMEAANKAYELDKSRGFNVEISEGVLGADLINGLKALNDRVQAGRADVFSKKAKVGQMVGPKGSMYEVDPKEETGRIQKMKEALQEQLRALVDDSLQAGTKVKLKAILKNNACS